MVFGTAWRILGNAADAEDVVQDVFLQVHQMLRTRLVRSWDGLCLAGGGDGPEETAAGRELAGRLRRAVAGLPPREAEVFCLRYFDDLSYQEIAAALGVRPGAVGVALHKARTRLEPMFSAAV